MPSTPESSAVVPFLCERCAKSMFQVWEPQTTQLAACRGHLCWAYISLVCGGTLHRSLSLYNSRFFYDVVCSDFRSAHGSRFSCSASYTWSEAGHSCSVHEILW